MSLSIAEMMDYLELGHLLAAARDEDIEKLEAQVEVHQQQNYPLKGSLANAKFVDGVVQLASGTASEYGTRDAWEESDRW